MDKELKKILRRFDNSRKTQKYQKARELYLERNTPHKAKIESINWAKKVLRNRDDYVILDTETTGLYNAEIVQIAVINLEGETILNTLVRPTLSIPYDVYCIHGINDYLVKDAPTFSEIHSQIIKATFCKTVIIYNSEFDQKIIKYCCKLHDSSPILFPSNCLMERYAEYYGDWSNYFKSYKWQKLPQGDHTALGDCLAALNLLNKMAETKVNSIAELVEKFDNYWFNRKIIERIEEMRWEGEDNCPF